MTPGFGLAKGKVDEVRVRTDEANENSMSGSGSGTGKHTSASAIRLPPGMRKGAGNGNL